MIQPSIARELHLQRTAELEEVAQPRRFTQQNPPSRSRGFVAVHVVGALVALGWRLGGPAALSATLRRRLA